MIAEHSWTNVSEVQRITGKSWHTCRKMLGRMKTKGILEDRANNPKLKVDPNQKWYLAKPKP